MVMYNDHMQSVSVTEFKAHCLEFLAQVAKTGEPILLLKRGKPTAIVSPPPGDTKTWTPGKYRDEITIVADLVAPYGEPWEALQDDPS